MSASEDEVRQLFENIAGVSSKTLGGLFATGAAVFLGAPLVAPLLAPYLAQNLERVGKELIQRQLGPRQELRASALYILSAKKIEDSLKAGKKLREDAFFLGESSERSPADEFTESAFNAAMRSYQEKRIPFIANVFANVCFDSAIDSETAHTAIQIADTLSYRDLCILKAAAASETLGFQMRPERGEQRTYEIDALLADCLKLSQRGLVAMKYEHNSTDTFLYTNFAELEPKYLKLHGIGPLLSNLLEVRSIPDSDPTWLGTVRLLEEYSRSGKSNSIINGGKF